MMTSSGILNPGAGRAGRDYDQTEILRESIRKTESFLDVLAKRDDGYHDLCMIMQSVGLHDDVSILLNREGRYRAQSDRRYLPCDERNIALRAAKLFLERTGHGDLGASVRLRKRVPVCAGLGGGSSDAAAVLRALNRHFDRPLTLSELEALGLELGSDVPYCIAGGTMLAQGRGEVLTPLTPMPETLVVICKPDFPVKDRFPKLVYASLTGYGEKGPDKDLPGFDYTAFFARSGWSGSLYQKGTVPSNLIPALGDHQAALSLTVGILAALFRAKMTGQGEKVTTNLLHTAIWVQAFQIQGCQYGDEFGGVSYPFDRRDNQLPYQPAVKTADDRFLQVMGPNFGIYYPLICKAIGREDVLDDPVLSDQVAMMKAGRLGEGYDIVQEGFQQKTLEEWIPVLTELDIPFAVCQTYEEVVKDEQAWANDVFYEMDYPRGKKALVRTPITFEETPLPPYEKAPLLGEHTEEIPERATGRYAKVTKDLPRTPRGHSGRLEE